MDMTTDLATLTPAEIDTELAAIWAKLNRANLSKWSYEKRLRDAQAGRDNFYASPHRQAELAEWIAKLDTEVKALEAEAAPLDAEFERRGGWLRYFLVQNNNGHVHRGMECSTCFWSTQYSWLIDLADCDEDAMIEEWGEKACTVCFPSAPTNPFYNRPSRLDREATAAKEAERQAKHQAKADKAAAKLVREAKAAEKAALKATGHVKLSPTERRGEGIRALSEAFHGPGPGYNAYDFDAALPLAQALLALGKTDHWQSTVKQVIRAIENRDQHSVIQGTVYLCHAS